MGFSVLSIVEILYFISMRPYLINRREKTITNNKTENGKKELTQASPKITLKQKFKTKTMTRVAWMKYDDMTGVDRNYVPFPYTE